ncbi:MAG: hypothetical protein QOG72_2089 [Sphingomonadales bacterium]|jgi:hypothetical protein|nr:hypothetical protein [Sphingomonadales bacterium]
MSLLCALGGHEAAAGEVYNGGYYFARCRRCESDMIRCGAAWQMVPSGHRVVWRSGRGQHSLEPDLAGVLPVLHRDSNLPAVRPPFASWSRDMVRLRRRPRGRAAAAAAEAVLEREEPQYPGLLVLAALVGAGLQLIFSLGSGRGGLG